MFFLVNILLIQSLKSQKIILPTLKYQSRNKYPSPAKNYKRIPFSCRTCPLLTPVTRV
jgi:hypothetical protein